MALPVAWLSTDLDSGSLLKGDEFGTEATLPETDRMALLLRGPSPDDAIPGIPCPAAVIICCCCSRMNWNCCISFWSFSMSVVTEVST